jgi:hypothetical protein
LLPADLAPDLYHHRVDVAPDLQDAAVQKVLQQAEALLTDWAV